MAPDVPTREFLAQLAGAGGPRLFEMTVADARVALAQLTRHMDLPAMDVAAVEQHTAPGPAGPVPVRFYRPGTAAPTPLLLLIHGGGFALGDLDTHDGMARFLCANAGVTVASVDYRRSPEHPFPAAVEDCYAALTWMAQAARSLGIDPARIALCGDSAGGNLSAVLCHLARERGGPMPLLQVLLYPVVDLSTTAAHDSRRQFGGGEYFLSLADMDWIAGMYFTDQARDGAGPLASPLLVGDLSNLPPALIITAGFDPLVDEGARYAERLRGAGVPVEYRCYEGTIHGFMSFPAALPAGREALALVADRVRAALSG